MTGCQGTDGDGAGEAKARRRPSRAAARKATKPVDAEEAGTGSEPELSEEPAEEVSEEEASEEEAKPRKAKRARTEAQTKKSPAKPKPVAKAKGAAKAMGEEAPDDAEAAGEEAATKLARARKPRAKKEATTAQAAEAGAEAGAGGSEVEAAAKPKAKAKRGQKAEPLPQYTMDMRKPPPPEGVPAVKVLSWNVAGLRALLKKTPDAVSKLVEREGADVVCLQEHKLQGGHTGDVEGLMGLKGWHHHWACSTAKLGYSGVSVHTREKPLSVLVGLGSAGSGLQADKDPDPEHEVEGRVVTVELPAVFVVSVYVPNSGEGLKRLDYRVKRWDGAFAAYIRGLEKRGKPVVVTGDLNCAHKEIDIHAPKTNLRSAGFTVEERESFGRLLLGEVGLVDTFRTKFPGLVAYTYFTRRFNCREQNKGWRLDYFLTTSSLMPPPATPSEGAQEGATEASVPAEPGVVPPTEWRVYDTWIMQDVYGSDHLPLGLTLVKEASG